MTEESSENGAAKAEAPQVPRMQVLAQYVRDLSFENLAAQKGVQREVKPDIQVAVNLDAKKRDTEHQFEVTQKYKITATSKGGDQHIFVLELEYTGIYRIEGVPEGQLHPYLLIECPRMLFPYVRRIVGDVTRDGGFPPLNLEAVDFLKLYRNEVRRRAEAEAANTAPV